jgi:hypothetical protein
MSTIETNVNSMDISRAQILNFEESHMRCFPFALATSMAITFAHCEPAKLSKDLTAHAGPDALSVAFQGEN